jgi:hypothetical protein
MSILDDAIREHLELKRAHGADETELKRLEDEAFGQAERPGQESAASDTVDPFAEAPTEFLKAPESGEESGRRVPNIADLQEPPPPGAAAPEAGESKATGESTETPAVAEGEGAEETGDSPAAAEQSQLGGLASDEPQTGLASDGPQSGGLASDQPQSGGLASDEPAVEEHPAMEHEAIARPADESKPATAEEQLRPDPDAPADNTPSVEERHEIAEQPTQMFDVEQQLFEDTAESASPSDEQLIDAERAEPRIAPVPEEDEPADEFDSFFSEQRLSDELNQALEAPLPDEPSDEYTSPFLDPDAELGPAPDQTVEQSLPDESAEHELPSTEHELPSEEHDVPEPPRDAHQDAAPAEEFQPHEPGHVDALEDKPTFLEEDEDEDAWFEQKPPKDFDFGD